MQEKNDMKDKEDIDASKERKVVQDALNKLISDEWFAGNVYKQFVVLVDNMYKPQVEDIMLETANDELNDHYASLVSFAKQNGYDVPSTYSEMKKYADKGDVKLFESCKKGQDSLYYLKEGVNSEERAIETYEKYIDDESLKCEPQLQVIIRNNFYDEQQHLEDFNFAIESIESFNKYNGGEEA